jgi:hypothetical protein
MSKKAKTEEAVSEEKKVYEEPKVEEVTPSEEPTEEAESKENLMYVGSTIPGLVRFSTVFAEGKLPQNVADAIEKYPLFKRLFVPIDEMVSALKDVKKDKSPLNVINKEAANKFTRRN